MKKLIIYMNNAHGALNFCETKQAIKDGVEFIESNCIHFFNFDVHLEDGYEIILHKDNQIIIASELLQGSKSGYSYTMKEIRRAHNIEKMLIAGAFTLRDCKHEYEIDEEVSSQWGIVHKCKICADVTNFE